MTADSKTPGKGPVLIDLEDEMPAQPQSAPAVPDTAEPGTSTAEGQGAAAMQTLAALGARPPSRLSRAFWGLLTAVLSLVLTVSAWNFVSGLLASNAVLGLLATVLIGLLTLVLLLLALRELVAFSRLGRIDRLRAEAEAALAAQDLGPAKAVVAQFTRLYSGRPDTAWGRERLTEQAAEVFDADALIALAENTVLAPLDAVAVKEVEAASRQVATVTALVPLALIDVFTALSANVRMIRRIAEVYGGRSGTLGAWRLTRAVLAHLVATGAVAVGDDLIGSVAGGSVLSKLSRRFGEGLINGALTARVGVAAIEVCRPLPFRGQPRPSVTAIMRRSLTGLFDTD